MASRSNKVVNRECGSAHGSRNLTHPVFGAVHPRRTCVQEGQKRARVQMPPHPLAGVVKDRQHGIAVRAGEPGPGRMLNPHIHPPVGY